MIFDRLKNFYLYLDTHPRFSLVFEWIKKTDLNALPVGRVEIGEGVYANVDQVALRDGGNAFLEAHDRYIDIQIPVTETENVGIEWRGNCHSETERNPDRDYVFYSDAWSNVIRLDTGSFVILFPEDAHAPLIGNGMMRKVVIKVPIA